MSTETITPDIVAETEQLSTIVRANSLTPDTAQSLQSSFLPLFTEARGILEKSRAITVTDASQKLEMRLAGECRKALKAVRISADKLRKELKDESLRKGRAIDGFNAILVHLIESEETRLEDQEKFVEKLEAQKRAQNKARREEQLRAFNVDTTFYQLDLMTEDAFQQLLANTIGAHEKRQEDARRAELERIAKDKADAAERERVRMENERLKREVVERDEAARVEREKAEVAREAAAAIARQERAILEAKWKAEQDAALAEAEKVRKQAAAEKAIAEEAQRQERLRLQAIAETERQKAAAEKAEATKQEAIRLEQAQAVAKKEREAREKAEAELNAQREAVERKAKSDALAAKKAASAPDRQKLVAYWAGLDGVSRPAMATVEGKAIMEDMDRRMHSLAMWLEAEANKL